MILASACTILPLGEAPQGPYFLGGERMVGVDVSVDVGEAPQGPFCLGEDDWVLMWGMSRGEKA
jgi:hypothetical protein